ncbi:MAG: glycosyltransferase family 2 protein [Lachnospiraceae bacterium]|nr:glycosyltransferase family 2 protein [Lachnospiraceae bacterium]
MNQSPLISVIIPIYNVEKFLHECVDSVLNQTYRNIEIILVDDGSTDKCPEICDEYAGSDNRIKVIHKRNGGLSDARNCGFKASSGEFITFVDSDDCIAKEMIEVLYTLCQKKNVQLAQCNYTIKHNDFDNITDGQEQGTLIKKERCMNELFGTFGTSFCVAWGKLFHRTVLNTIEFPVGKTHEDVYTTYLYFETAGRMVFTTKRLYYYRQQEFSLKAQEKKRPGLEELKANIEREYYFKNKGYEQAYISQVWRIINLIKYLYCLECAYWTTEQKRYMHKEYRRRFAKMKKAKISIEYWLFNFMPNIYCLFGRGE